MFKIEGHHSSLTVCPRHREAYGVGWKSGKVRCSIPSEFAGHKSLSAKGNRGINSKESAFVLFTGKTFLPIGTREYIQFSQPPKKFISSVRLRNNAREERRSREEKQKKNRYYRDIATGFKELYTIRNSP